MLSVLSVEKSILNALNMLNTFNPHNIFYTRRSLFICHSFNDGRGVRGPSLTPSFTRRSLFIRQSFNKGVGVAGLHHIHKLGLQ